MADGSFHPAGCGAEVLGYLGVEHLGDGVDHIHVIDGDDNGLPQILIALDVGGNADLVDNIGHKGFNADLVIAALNGIPQALPTPDLLHPLNQRGHVTGLQHQVANAQVCCRRGNVLRQKRGGGQRDRFMLHVCDCFEDADAVLFRQH